VTVDHATAGPSAGAAPALQSILDEGLFSADSHVIEAPELWSGLLPAEFWPDGGAMFKVQPGGHDPTARLAEMAVDGVRAEVLYPTLGLRLFGLDDEELQRRCFRRYNEWIADFCSVDRSRLLGVGMIPAYRIEAAVEELQFCAERGLRGALVWQAPDPRLPFSGPHYDPLWAEAARLGMPISMHILTGHDFSKKSLDVPKDRIHELGLDLYRTSVHVKLYGIMSTLLDIVFSGALERFPGLRLVLVENEVGWLPFVAEQWDYYYHRFRTANPAPIQRPPTSYLESQVLLTFFRDPIAGQLFGWWGENVCMWSNDFPHGNSTWPNSGEVIMRNLGHLPGATLDKLLRRNAMGLYGITSLGADR
jgi:predicted TIM-barrel fold metal-dependent hydrolase